ncbi:MAG: NfeD family protein, partial [Campylobacterota bacterium]|nr:NfeD family protein [Campylobacterota bacterium]
LEIVTASFVLFWFGIGFLLVAGVSYMYNFEEGMVQLAWAFSIGAILMYLLRAKFVQYVMASKEKHVDALEGEGEGVIENGKVFFRGTYWDADVSEFNEGDRVTVVKIDHGRVILKMET